MVQASLLSKDIPAPARSAEPRRLRLLVLASKARGIAPNQRFRLEQWAPRLAHHEGIDLDFAPFESPRLTELLYQNGRRAEKAAWVVYDFVRRLAPVVRARSYDAAVVVREAALLGPAVYERLLGLEGVPMFYDIDDAIWLSAHQSAASKANGVFSRLHFYGKTATICRLASGVLAGNEYLAAYARRRNGNVFVVPTSIELERYPIIPESSDPRFVVVWSGSLHTLAHFEHAREALERLAARRPIVVKVICNRPPDRPIAGAENVFVPWSEHGEAEAVGDGHVGIMPLPDDEFARGKCGLKALQFMATGRPVVASPVGMNSDLLGAGDNGILASTPDEWVAALERLATSPELRRAMGAAARRTIEERYSAEVVSKLFARAVRTTLEA
ncbi:MAG: glycosyltransferase [Labilithrix sp.]|nr:glycosyltransferase [Labilithrix sp.]MCW5814727.1 glycosyltransferase [Labilithrix sp.]